MEKQSILMVFIKVILLVIVLTFSSGFFSCRFSPIETEQRGTGVLQLILEEQGISRTVKPVLTIDSYRIYFANGPEEKSAVLSSNSMPEITLAIGSWDIRVEALNEAGGPVAEGEVSGIIISADTTTPVDLDLEPIESGTGTVDLIITWPEYIGIDSYEPLLNGSPINSGDYSVSSTEGVVRFQYSQELNAGVTFRFQLLLKTAALLQANVIEMVQIYGGLISQKTITLTDSDFTHTPTAPTDLLFVPGTITLTWNDTSNIETAFVVERSTGDESNYAVVNGSVSAGSESWQDTTAAYGYTYYYRMKAVNDFGESAYSNTSSDDLLIPAVTLLSPSNGEEVEDITPDLDWSDSLYTSEYYNLDIALDSGFDPGDMVVQESGLNSSDITLPSSLINGQTYYWRIKAVDGSDAYGQWSAVFSFTIDIDTDITITEDMNNPVTLLLVGYDAELLTGTDMNLTVTHSGTADSYSWYLDSQQIIGADQASVSFGSNLGDGSYTITSVVELDGAYLSVSYNFKVGLYYNLGDTGPAGGVIFFKDVNDDYEDFDYLEAAPGDISTGIQWYNGTNFLVGGTFGEIGYGENNTATIVGRQGAGSYAAYICKYYDLSDYNDWFLPSYDELYLMYQKRYSIGGFYEIGEYWSSSELNSDFARILGFSSGVGMDSGKEFTCRVRPIRAF
ncbi:MAG: hypothetical protein JEY99_07285 [Spirochaetales bacterium]|nr:hypothetical protein [Spirochaetales bacterium]